MKGENQSQKDGGAFLGMKHRPEWAKRFITKEKNKFQNILEKAKEHPGLVNEMKSYIRTANTKNTLVNHQKVLEEMLIKRKMKENEMKKMFNFSEPKTNFKMNSGIQELINLEKKEYQNRINKKRNEEKRLKDRKSNLLEQKKELKLDINERQKAYNAFPINNNQKTILSNKKAKLNKINENIKNINNNLNSLPEKHGLVNINKRFNRTFTPNKGLNEFTLQEKVNPYESTLFNETKNEFRNRIKNEFKNLSANEKTKFYRKLALIHHPNKGGNEEKFKILRDVYEKSIGNNNKVQNS